MFVQNEDVQWMEAAKISVFPKGCSLNEQWIFWCVLQKYTYVVVAAGWII